MYVRWFSLMFLGGCVGWFHLTAQSIPTPDSLFEWGRDAYYDGDYDRAERLYLEGLTAVQSDSSAPILDQLHFKKVLGDVYRKKRLFARAISYYNEVIQRADGLDEDTYIWARQNRAIVYELQHRLLRSVSEYKALLPRVAKLEGKESIGYSMLMMNIGTSYNDMNDYHKAEEWLLRVVEILQNAVPPDDVEFNRVYNNLGIVYLNLGDYPKAIAFAERALDIKLKNYDPRHPTLSKYYLNLGHSHFAAGDPERALPLYRKAAELDIENYGADHFYAITAKAEVANVLTELGQYEEALELYQSVYRLGAQYDEAWNPDFFYIYTNLAGLYRKMGRPEAAEQLLLDNLQRVQMAPYVSPGTQLNILTLLAEIYADRGEVERAIELMLRGIDKLRHSNDPEKTLPRYDEVVAPKAFIEALAELARLYQLNDNLPAAYRVLHRAVETIEWLRTTYHTNEAREYLNQETEAIFQSAVGVAFTLYEQYGTSDYLQQAFYFSEAARADRLRTLVNEGLALRSAGLPPPLLDSLDELRLRINGLDTEITDLLLDRDTTSAQQFTAEKFTLEQTYQQLLRDLETEYPEYYALKFGNTLVDVDRLQELIAERELVFISYYVDRERLYCFRLDGKLMEGSAVAHGGRMESKIERLRDYLQPQRALRATPEDLDHLHQLLREFYDLTQFANVISSPAQSVLVVPHGLLHYVPFEVLHADFETADPRRIDYVLRQKSISYTLSADLWARKVLSSPARATVTYAGFAPDYGEPKSVGNGERSSAWVPLGWNAHEVRKAAQYFPDGMTFTDSLATIDRFVSIAPHSRVLHLAMHAEAYDDQPLKSGLIFDAAAQTQPLRLHAIYDLNLSAELVIMNACQTGVGELIAGEGVVSMAHAFTHAGAQRTLMNLWLADDQAASEVVLRFLDARSQMDDAAALRRAKLDYLDHTDPLRAHPYFWAGLRLQVARRPDLPTSQTWWWITGAFAILGLGWIAWQRQP